MKENDILHKASKHSDQAEVFSRNIEKTRIGWESNLPRTAEKRGYSECALRLVKNNSLGFATASSGASSDDLVDAALSSANAGLPAPSPFAGPSSYPDIKVDFSDLRDLCPAKMKEIGSEALDMILSTTPGVAQNIVIEKAIEELNIVTSAGLEASFSRTTLAFMLEGKIIDSNNFIHFEEEVWRRDTQIPWKELVERAIYLYDAGYKNVPVTSDVMPVLLSPQAFYSILKPVEAAFTGRNIHQGTSPLAGKQDQLVFSPLLTIYDDGLHPESPNSGPFDDEGVACRKTRLLKNGVMCGSLWDRTTATDAGCSSTGNGFKLGRFFRTRKIEARPITGLTTLVVEPGDTPAEELKKMFPEILQVESVMGAGQANNLAGDFSVNVSTGILLRNGEPSGSVKDIMISGNIHEMLKNLQGISRESSLCQIYLGAWEAPFILTAPMRITAR